MRSGVHRAMTGRRLRASFASSRPALTLFVVLAFLFQSLLTQTHVHLLTDHDSGFAVALGGNSDLAKSSSQERDHNKLPSKDAPDNCPLCQQILIAGAFLSPSTVAVALPTQLSFVPPTALVSPGSFRAVSHSWYGRGPPIA